MHRFLLLGAAVAVAAATRPEPSASARPLSGSALRDVKCESGIAMLSENDPTLSDLEVDVLAKPRRTNREPKFPSVLRGSATLDASYKEMVSGEVVARFVVDTLGCVDIRTFTVVTTTDSAFTEEILKVLPKYKYDPARKEGKKVRAWLTWKFLFYKEPGVRNPF